MLRAGVHISDWRRERNRRVLEGLAGRGRLVEVQHADVDELLAERSPDPRLPLDEGTTNLEAVVLDVLNRVARRRALDTLRVGDVLRFELVGGAVEAALTAELVAAALGHEVDADAAGLLRHVDATGRDRHFLEAVEVVVARRRAGRVHVGDVDAVERPLVVEGARAARRVIGLLTGHVAADVLAVHRDAGRLLEDDPRVARRRNALQQLVGERLLGAGFLGVDDRARTGDRDRFLNGRDAHLRVDLRTESDRDDDVLIDDGLETSKVELHRVGADFQTWKLIGPGFARDRRERLQEVGRGESDRDPGEHRSRTVRHLAEDFTGLLLRARQRARGKQRRECQDDCPKFHSSSSKRG